MALSTPVWHKDAFQSTEMPKATSHATSTGKTKMYCHCSRKIYLKEKCIQYWGQRSIMGRTCSSGIHVSYTARAQEQWSTSGVLSSEISARDASSDGVFLNELLHKSNCWQMLFLSRNYTFSFTNSIERQASSRTVAMLSYVSFPLLTRPLVLNAQPIPW